MPEHAFVHPVVAASVADRVTSEIRRAILSGRLAPGQNFSLRQVASQLGVSFIPVREALRSLEAEGLLVTRRGRSATVAPLDPAELDSICQLRRRIEPELAARSLPLLSVAELDRLQARAQASMKSSESIDDQFDEYHAVYLDLLRPAATSWDLRVVRMLSRAVERYLRSDLFADSDAATRRDQCGAMLSKLIDAFGTGDEAAVRASVTEYVNWAERLNGGSLSEAS